MYKNPKYYPFILVLLGQIGAHSMEDIAEEGKLSNGIVPIENTRYKSYWEGSKQIDQKYSISSTDKSDNLLENQAGKVKNPVQYIYSKDGEMVSYLGNRETLLGFLSRLLLGRTQLN